MDTHNLLLVEDSPDSEERIRSLLKSMNVNLNIKCVPSAESAIQLLDEDEFDFVIADHFLQGSLTGLDLWRLCRHNGKLLPFLLTSGLERKDFLNLVESDRQSPLFLPKYLDPSSSLKALTKFMESYIDIEATPPSAVSTDRWVWPEIRAFSLSLFFLYLFIPLQMNTPDPDVRKVLKAEDLNGKPQQQPSSDKDRRLKTEPPREWQAKDIITPELKMKVQIVLKRAERIKAEAHIARNDVPSGP